MNDLTLPRKEIDKMVRAGRIAAIEAFQDGVMDGVKWEGDLKKYRDTIDEIPLESLRVTWTVTPMVDGKTGTPTVYDLTPLVDRVTAEAIARLETVSRLETPKIGE